MEELRKEQKWFREHVVPLLFCSRLYMTETEEKVKINQLLHARSRDLYLTGDVTKWSGDVINKAPPPPSDKTV